MATPRRLIARFARTAPPLAALALVACLGLAQGPAGAAVAEPPALADTVAAGTLAPMAERLPAEPLVVDMPATGREIGRYGGSLRIIEAQARDTRRMVVFGYARLVGYTPDGRIEPDLARAVDVEAGRIFTIHLRRGHKWSDGAPFTAEDFRYYWEDVVNDPKLGKNGLPRELLVDGEGPRVSFPDDVTIRYEWTKPNPFFLPAMARSLALEIFRPAHYLKQFHQKYADPASLEGARSGGGSAQTGWRCTSSSISPTRTPISSCRRCSPGCSRPRRRPTAISSAAIPTSTGSTRRGSSSPISTRWR